MSLTHPYIWTATGKKLVIEDLKPEMIDIKSIAYGLAKECRFGGQIEGFYSVARHSLILREALRGYLPRTDWIYVLLHDAAEAYLRDMLKPIKLCLPDYNRLEAKMMEVILQRFNLPGPFPGIIKQFDTRIVLDEAKALFNSAPIWTQDFEDHGISPLGVKIEEYPWRADLQEFLTTFHRDMAARQFEGLE